MDTERTVLIVDDDPDVLDSTRLLVEALGYRAVALQDAGDILDVAEREGAGLILQDLRMVGLNVSGLVASLRSNPATAEIPLVFFSADTDLPSAASRYAVWGFLQKPFGERELRRILEDVFGSPEGGEADAREAARDVREAFHEQWNLISALANYAHALRERESVDAATRQALNAFNDLVLRLEANTDRLQGFVAALARGVGKQAGAKAPGVTRPPRPRL